MSSIGAFVGLSTVDLIYGLETYPTSNSKSVAKKFQVCAGGPAANAAITFSYLGGEGHLISPIGKHPLASLIKEDFKAQKVQVVDLLPNSTQLPRVASIISTEANGDRAVIAMQSLPLKVKAGVVVKEVIRKSRIVLVDGHYMPVAVKATQEARQRGIPIVMDGGSWKKGTEELLKNVDIAICSENFYPPLARNEKETLLYLSKVGVRYAVITRGQNSILFQEGAEINELAVQKVSIVDTLGAGDIFHGAFCYYYMTTASFIESLVNASIVAGKSCQFFGTREWMTK